MDKMVIVDRWDERSMSFEEKVKRLAYRFQFALDRIYGHFPDKKVSLLDVGCGDGVFIKKCLDEGFTLVEGADIDSKVWEECKNNTGIEPHSSIEEVSQSYDVVSAISVVEHVEDYKKFLQEMWSRVNEKGLLIIVVPIESQLDSLDHKHYFNFYEVLEFADMLKPKPKDHHIYMINKFVKDYHKVNEFALVVFK